jgi:hypothetical protein
VYRRPLYFEDLHVFAVADDRVVASARTVPHAGLYPALYNALRYRRRPGLSEALLAGAGGNALPPPSSSDEVVLLREVRTLVPDVLPASPIEVLARAEERVDEAVSRSLASKGIEEGLDFFSDASALDEAERRFRDPSDALSALVQSEDFRSGWVALSHDVDRAVKQSLRRELEASRDLPGLVLYEDLERDLRLRLYTDERYMRFLRRVMEAPGSFASPAVRDFLTFYVEALNRRLAEAAAETGATPEGLRRRLETHLGRQRTAPHYTLHYHVLTILGCPVEGALPPDPGDPDASGGSHRVAGDWDIGELLLVEVRGPARRFVVRKLVQWSYGARHNVERVSFVDEET